MKRAGWWVSAIGLLGAALAAPATARAQVLEQQLAPLPNPEPWQAALGIRNTFLRSAGYDPFSSSDVLTQVSLSGERTVTRRDALAFAAGAAFDYGGSDATARSAPSSIRLMRLSLVAEGRYYAWPRAYGFVRAAPGMLRTTAEVDDPSTLNGQPLVDRFAGLSLDASAGAAVRLTNPGSPVAAWITAEAGYGWAASHHLLLATQVPARDQAKLAPLDLGTIDPRGVFMRLAAAIAF
jgi:hypothetical protein